MKIAITGHRPNKLGNDYNLTSQLIKWIELQILDILFKEDVNRTDLLLITGMALGIDTLFANIAIENNIPFIAAIPCIEQEKVWPNKSKDIYRTILANSLCTRYLVSEIRYDNTCMQKRNEWMVNKCDLLIAVWNGTNGGTHNCIKYAELKSKQIIRINPKDFNIFKDN